MKNSEVLAVGLIAAVVVVYALSQKAAVVTGSPNPSTGTNPQATNSANAPGSGGATGQPGNSVTTVLNDINQVGGQLASWLNGPASNTGSTNSTGGTSTSNGWVDTLSNIV